MSAWATASSAAPMLVLRRERERRDLRRPERGEVRFRGAPERIGQRRRRRCSGSSSAPPSPCPTRQHVISRVDERARQPVVHRALADLRQVRLTGRAFALKRCCANCARLIASIALPYAASDVLASLTVFGVKVVERVDQARDLALDRFARPRSWRRRRQRPASAASGATVQSARSTRITPAAFTTAENAPASSPACRQLLRLLHLADRRATRTG